MVIWLTALNIKEVLDSALKAPVSNALDKVDYGFQINKATVIVDFLDLVDKFSHYNNIISDCLWYFFLSVL